jgi:hypothetical protein
MRKLAMTASVGLNVALAFVFVLFVARSRQSSTAVSPRAQLTPAPPIKEDVAPAPETVSATPEKESFRWTQLESEDYRKYVSNLRSIGCPERTLRAIITAELDEVCAKRAAELKLKLDGLQTGSLEDRLKSISAQQALQVQLQQLSAAESARLSDLLGSSAAGGETGAGGADPDPASQRNLAARAQAPAVMPLVLQNVDPSALGLNAEQIQVIEDLRQSFSDAVGGPDQDPSDPAYLARWQKAQPEIDEELRGMLGVTVFEKFEMAVIPPPLAPAQKP